VINFLGHWWYILSILGSNSFFIQGNDLIELWIDIVSMLGSSTFLIGCGPILFLPSLSSRSMFYLIAIQSLVSNLFSMAVVQLGSNAIHGPHGLPITLIDWIAK